MKVSCFITGEDVLAGLDRTPKGICRDRIIGARGAEEPKLTKAVLCEIISTRVISVKAMAQPEKFLQWKWRNSH